MRYDDDYEGVDPLELSNKNYARWWLGSCLCTLMHDVRLNPEELRYLHRDVAENDSILLRELIHRFQKDMTHNERLSFREHLTLLFPPRK